MTKVQVISGKAMASKLPAKDPLGQLSEAAERMMQAVIDCKIICEQEKTKRVAINAQKEIEIKKIQAQRALMEQVIEKAFAQRGANFDKFFKALDVGIASGDAQIMEIAMSGIIAQIQSPAMQEVNAIMAQLNNSNAGCIEF